MQPKGPGEVPAETVRVARAAFPKGSLAIRVRDELGPMFTDEEFADLFPVPGKPAWSPGRLALVLVLQFVEGLTDRRSPPMTPKPAAESNATPCGTDTRST